MHPILPGRMDCRNMHSCPLITGGIPHNGGPVIGPGCTTVLIEGKPASVAGERLQVTMQWCNGYNRYRFGQCFN